MFEDIIKRKYQLESEKYGMDDRRSLFWTKDKQNMRFNLLLGEEYKCSNMTLLDYGCGFCDLSLFLEQNYYYLQYHGCDINPDFIKKSKRKFPEKNIFSISTVNSLKNNYDIILASGTFNLIGVEDSGAREKYVIENLQTLFDHTSHMLTVNFLSHTTDNEYKYKGHYYLNPMKLYEYAVAHMTKRIQIDTASLPYEITMKFYKNDTINTNTVTYNHI